MAFFDEEAGDAAFFGGMVEDTRATLMGKGLIIVGRVDIVTEGGKKQENEPPLKFATLWFPLQRIASTFLCGKELFRLARSC